MTGVLTPKSVVAQTRPSASGGANVSLLFDVLDRVKGVEGDVAECGVWRGRTLVAMAIYLHQHKINKRIWGFDSFEGFDGTIAHDIALGGDSVQQKRVGGFNDTSYDLLVRKLSVFGVSNVDIEPGYFNESLPRCTANKFCFVHIDCDIYEGYKSCLNHFYPRVSKGGIILFDEYNDPAWPGANKAVDEFLWDKPERPEPISRDNYQKWFVVKN